MMRKSTIFFVTLLTCGSAFCLALVHARLQSQADLAAIGRTGEMVKTLRLTDLCLFTEARYMRNPSQADLHSPFQDHPMSLEHFPAGSFGRDVARIKRFNGALD